MTKTLLIAASLTAVAIPSVAQAQALPAAVVAVVDIEKVTSTCNACRTAITALQGQVTALQNRERTLGTPLETEGKSIQTAIDALNGKEPDAALKTRVQSFGTKRQQAMAELERGKQQIGLNQQYVNKQIGDKLGPIYSQVMQKRGANLMVEIGTTLASGAALDVTNDVLTALNAALPSISTTAPAQPAQQQRTQPQGR
ncbi:OmpH family outer membrane protein [Sphingomonas flavescens]|uniref:OmpH family outer membrane protein n=1 Tax=Sphingomonas flavescens TaxID=3132797 RepID=UPI002805B8AC|nr:OmpH family outer membrane protein [Sphingomonas limnosediminicola]